jgi:hypothetical protein
MQLYPVLPVSGGSNPQTKASQETRRSFSSSVDVFRPRFGSEKKVTDPQTGLWTDPEFLHKGNVVKIVPNSDLRRKDLSGANLEGANLEGASLNDTHLASANLKKVNLNKAHLSGANLTHATLPDDILEQNFLVEGLLAGGWDTSELTVTPAWYKDIIPPANVSKRDLEQRGVVQAPDLDTAIKRWTAIEQRRISGKDSPIALRPFVATYPFDALIKRAFSLPNSQ